LLRHGLRREEEDSFEEQNNENSIFYLRLIT